MTKAEKRSLTEHLAEKVCGWTIRRETLLYGASLVLYCNPDGSLAVPSTFAPLTDPRDTALVMEAWRKSERGLSLEIDTCSGKWVSTADDMDDECKSWSWTEAVCLAIYRASIEGERS